jgi:hypothetical protein
MSKQLNDFILPIVSIIAILVFVFMYGAALVETWAAVDQAPVFGGAFQYIATALCGLVGGITAKGLGQPYTPITGATIQEEKTRSVFFKRMIALSSMVSPFDSQKTRTWIASLYILVFVLFGLGAAITWAFRETVTPEMVKNLAMISIGLIIPSLQSFLTAEKPVNTPA